MKRPPPLSWLSRSAAETKKIGAAIGKNLRPGDVVLLLGNLGAGKTTLVQGLVRALGARETALSPTFVIAQTLKGRFPIHHLDFYRLAADEILARGVQDYLLGAGEIPRGVVLIEWADRLRDLWPPDRLEVRIRIKPRSRTREIKLAAHGERFRGFLENK